MKTEDERLSMVRLPRDTTIVLWPLAMAKWSIAHEANDKAEQRRWRKCVDTLSTLTAEDGDDADDAAREFWLADVSELLVLVESERDKAREWAESIPADCRMRREYETINALWVHHWLTVRDLIRGR